MPESIYYIDTDKGTWGKADSVIYVDTSEVAEHLSHGLSKFTPQQVGGMIETSTHEQLEHIAETHNTMLYVREKRNGTSSKTRVRKIN